MTHFNRCYVLVNFEDDIHNDALCDYYEIPINDDINDIVAFLYQKKFGVEYQWNNWKLQKGAEEFVNKIEDDWFHNKIDTVKLYQDQEMIKFASLRHADELADSIAEEAVEYRSDDDNATNYIDISIDELGYETEREIGQ